MKQTNEKFTFFWDGPFSQWCESKFYSEGIEYNCAEQFMMAHKAELFADHNAVTAILATKDPVEQKRIGRSIEGYSDELWHGLRGNGRPYCWNVVRLGNRLKFEQHEGLMKELLKTAGTTLVEASPVDTIWGIGLKASDPLAQNRATWRGKNWLGEVLTDVRETLLHDLKEARW
ncbi:NADAR family protein [Candidatus Babeliales bacterium]|nr:NADAR family protein [Candidatus Babeliales bacterium]